MKRRKFIRQSSASLAAGFVGSRIVFSENIPTDYIPLSEQVTDPFNLYQKHEEMILLNDRPFNMEAAAHLLNDPVTTADKMFSRNNGIIPESINENEWSLQIDGESVEQSQNFSLDYLKKNFSIHSYLLTLECAGNGRSEFNPPASGNQWTLGAVSCARWTGVRLKDVLEKVGVKNDAVYVGYYGADRHLSGDRTKFPISRGIPIAKAMMDETLLAFEMNGAPIPIAHGFPLRLVAGGWPASTSGKWINRLSVRNIIHDGPKMGGMSYRVPCAPVTPGDQPEPEDMCIIESMPVKSLISNPKSGAILHDRNTLKINGHAWAGESKVAYMHYSIDFGATWISCQLNEPANRLAWQQWEAEIRFPEKGYYEVWARATDDSGKSQPMVIPGWNPRGYLNNACHRIAVKLI